MKKKICKILANDIFHKCISIKTTKQIVNPIIVTYAANFKVYKMKQFQINRIEKLRSDGCYNI